MSNTQSDVSFILGKSGRFTARSIAEDIGDVKMQYALAFTLSELVRQGRIQCVGCNLFSENVYEVVR